VHHRAAGRLFAVIAAGAALLALSGCSSAPESRLTPSVVETPAIVWRDGVEPSSPLEESRFVKFLRANLLGEVVAWNAGDFTIDQFISTTSPARVRTLVERYESQYTWQVKYLGPTPFEPLRVTESKDGESAEIVLCEAADADTQIETAGIPSESPHLSARIAKLHSSKSGRLVVTDGFSHSDESCAGVTVPVGFFDPRPTLPTDALKEPISEVKRAPLKWQLDELKKTVG
jgi:hypothetical protein